MPGDHAPKTAPGSSDSSDSSDSDPPPEPAAPYVAFEVNHVISTGQSNSVAHEGRPVISVTQPFTNLMFNVGVMTSGVCEHDGCREYQRPTSFVPLVEGDSFWYPVETMSSGLGNEGSMLATTLYKKAKHDILVSLAGRNGLTYWCLRKGGCNYLDPTYLNAFDENLRQVADAKAIATAAGKSYVVRAVTAIHGESVLPSTAVTIRTTRSGVSVSTSARPTRARSSKVAAGSRFARARSRTPPTSSPRSSSCPHRRSCSTRSGSWIRGATASRSPMAQAR